MKLRTLISVGITVAAGVLLNGTIIANATVFETIKQRGHLKCASYENVAGISTIDSKGEWRGLEVDFCRAVSAAVFGSPDKVEFVPSTFSTGVTAVSTGEVDLAGLAITMNISRDTDLGFDFIGPLVFTGLGFMVHKDLEAKTFEDLDGASICISAGTNHSTLITEVFRQRGITFKPVAFAESAQRLEAYESNRCDVYTTEIPILAATRERLKDPTAHDILEEVYQKSFTGMFTREIDPKWVNVVRTTYYGLIEAEELGINQANIDEMQKSEDPEIQRFLGVAGNVGEAMGIPNDFMVKVLQSVGNYDDIWQRNLGANSPMKLPRGMNELYTNGGLLWSPTWR
ncbi:amino acid ABC transporter substrate-binding protein [Falsochrobactrum shanghaiense]|uniref:Amino acid ABC transporter substrate-binding protein n=1 Tax=Falsochrobactrum shanghaiense TaxID=2201899 RepID=A0A316J3E3_9HYPH|nr:transporter substrate-binding domain-containing protein [Falsochrobactrum shanghaiense]PWL16204.1 amino acid ABC transporter substrate-binding protein [Falsochrobactrum shanghaiense]